MESNKLKRSRDLLLVYGDNRIINSGTEKARWMSIEDCFSYYSPFSELKITMEFPDHDQGQINSEEVTSAL